MSRRLDVWRWEPASPEVAVLLRTLAGERVLYARRTDLLAGQPVAYDKIYLLGRCADVLQEADLAMLAFLERWQEVQQIALAYGNQVIEAVAAEGPVAQLLAVESRTPILKGTEVYFLADDCPAGVFISYYRHDIFRLTGTVRLLPQSSVPSNNGDPML
jgi:DNA-binding GntR family transcriptional regulator